MQYCIQEKPRHINHQTSYPTNIYECDLMQPNASCDNDLSTLTTKLMRNKEIENVWFFP